MTKYTDHYNLDLYEGADKPNLLDQYQAAVKKIDTQLYKSSNDSSTALDYAKQAKEEIDTAVNTAKNAKSTADTALATANTAKTTATSAESTATKAKTAAETAVADAAAAQAAAESAAQDAEDAEQVAINSRYINAPRGLEIVGHRGSFCTAPENTIRSFQDAERYKYDSIECDVQQTTDGFVISHDNDVSVTTSGTGNFSDMSTAAATSLVVNKKNNTWYPFEVSPTDFVPSIESFVKFCAGSNFEHIYIEIKNVEDDRLGDLVEAVAAIKNRVIFIGFNSLKLQILSEQYGATCIWCCTTFTQTNINNLVNMHIHGVDFSFAGSQSTELIKAALKAGLIVGAWDYYSNSYFDLKQYVDAGVSFITTDNIAILPATYETTNTGLACTGAFQRENNFTISRIKVSNDNNFEQENTTYRRVTPGQIDNIQGYDPTADDSAQILLGIQMDGAKQAAARYDRSQTSVAFHIRDINGNVLLDSGWLGVGRKYVAVEQNKAAYITYVLKTNVTGNYFDARLFFEDNIQIKSYRMMPATGTTWTNYTVSNNPNNATVV